MRWGGVLLQDLLSTDEIALVRVGCNWQGYAINCPWYVSGTQECHAAQPNISVEVDNEQGYVFTDAVAIYCGKAI